MSKLIDISGKKFGKWTVLYKTGRLSKSPSVYWMCKCDCGTERNVRGSLLTEGLSTNCRCVGIEKRKGIPVTPALPFGYAARNMIKAQYKRAARKANRDYTLPDEKFYFLISSNCFYCGEEPKQVLKARKMNGSFTYNGIDRIDNEKGYTIENVVTCCIVCNRAKRCMEQKDFIEWLKRVAKRWSSGSGE